MNKQKKTRIYEMTTCALMTAIMCVAGPISVPIGPIPVSLTNFVLYLSIYILGTRGTCISYLIYLLLGAVGLPVFSGYAGGLAKLTGPTGGYLVGFLFMVLISGIAVKRSQGDKWISMGGMVIATAVDYLLGTLWFVFQMNCALTYALSVCVAPFIVFDLGKIILATVLGKQIRKPLMKAGCIS